MPSYNDYIMLYDLFCRHRTYITGIYYRLCAGSAQQSVVDHRDIASAAAHMAVLLCLQIIPSLLGGIPSAQVPVGSERQAFTHIGTAHRIGTAFEDPPRGMPWGCLA
jgi:hypothetical protein